MSTHELTEREAALWDRGGRDVDFRYPVLAVAVRWYPDASRDKEYVYDHIRKVVSELQQEDSKKYIAGTRELEGRGAAAELTPEGGLELGGRLGLILNSRRRRQSGEENGLE